jgi:predicted acylesterase/phospholipase RssA
MSRLRTLVAAGLIGIALAGLAQPTRAQETTAPPKTKAEAEAEESLAVNRTGDEGLVREVRLALVCYGGSSLAIYIHGNAKELQRLVKASKALQLDAVYSMVGAETMQDYMAAYPRNPKPPRGPEFANLEGSAQAWYDRLLDLWTNDEQRVRTRVVVDVIAGTSAGGINGVFLAKALANDLSQDALTELWMEKASIRRLTDNYFRFFKVLVGGEPINGKAMAGWLYDALRDMDRKMVPGRHPSLLPRGDRLDLFVTTTDLLGYPQQVIINNPPFAAEKHFPHVLHFIYSGQNNGCAQSSGKGPDRSFNDFCPEWTPAMAFAARASSSIPGVFPPLHLGDTLEQFKKMPPGKPILDVAPTASNEDVVKRLFRNHQLQQLTTSNEEAPNEGVDYAMKTYFVDGGVLDNHPFGPAIAEVLRRPQDQEVRRFLIYLQPDPGKTPAPPSGKQPSLVKTIKAGLSAIPSQQPILNELNDIAEYNEKVQRIRDIVHSEEVATQAFEKREKEGKVPDSLTVDERCKTFESLTAEHCTNRENPNSLASLESRQSPQNLQSLREECKNLASFAKEHCGPPLTVAQRLAVVAGFKAENLDKQLTQADQNALRQAGKAVEKEADRGVTAFAGRSYYNLRVHSVLDQFVDVIADEGVNNYPPESAHRALVAAIIARWAETSGLTGDPASKNVRKALEQDAFLRCLKIDGVIDDLESPEGRQKALQRCFLTEFDVGYQRRQLRFVTDWINTQYTAEPTREQRRALDKLKAAAAKRINELTQLVKGRDTDPELIKELGALKELFKNLRPWRGPDGKEWTIDKAADDFLATEQTALDTARDHLGAALRRLQQDVRDRSFKDFKDLDFKDLDPVLNDKKKREILVRYFGFPFWDRQIYPLVAFSDLGELTKIEVVRLSPDDAKLLGGGDAKTKLVGAKFAHFGAFLSRRGREADYVWGRLDAAERLLAVLGLEEEKRKQVAGDLFLSIIKEVEDKEKDLIRASILEDRKADIALHFPSPPK